MTTFTIGPDWIRCSRCGLKSYNPNDVANRYCGSCHRFHEDDEQLVGPRAITTCVAGDDGWDCVLACGHEVWLAIEPPTMTLAMCAQCVHLLLERRRQA
jgi:hypothetical protein